MNDNMQEKLQELVDFYKGSDTENSYGYRPEPLTGENQHWLIFRAMRQVEVDEDGVETESWIEQPLARISNDEDINKAWDSFIVRKSKDPSAKELVEAHNELEKALDDKGQLVTLAKDGVTVRFVKQHFDGGKPSTYDKCIKKGFREIKVCKIEEE